MNNTNLDVINEFDDVSISDIKKEFKGKYGIDIKKVLYDEELRTATDIKYHGKHKGHDMVTYIDTSDNTLMGVNNNLNIDIPDSCIGYKKDVNLMVEELKSVIDWTVDNIRK